MIVFEDWIGEPFSKTNQEPESAINLAGLYWQGLDQDFHLVFAKVFLLKLMGVSVVFRSNFENLFLLNR